MAKKTQPWQSKKLVPEQSVVSKEKDAPMKAPETLPVEEPAVSPIPVAETVKVVKKKARYVRERKKKEPETKAVKAAPRSKTTAAKTLTKNLPISPVEDDSYRPEPRYRRKR